MKKNSESDEARLTGMVCTANLAGVADGEWALIAPYGEHPAPDGSYVQHFDRAQAEKMVAAWNSLTGRAARLFKNLWHGRGAVDSVPAWEGHPETDRRRWPQEKLLCEITELRAGAEGLEGRITWHAPGLASRERGPLYPSPLWWHLPPAGTPPTVFPELLESVGLVPKPNLAGVPAWTPNARLSENTNMNPELLQALARALQQPEDTEPQPLLEQALARLSTLTTANQRLEELTAEVELLRAGVLDLAETRGALAPAERESFAGRLATANAGAALQELQTRHVLNTRPVELNGDRLDLSTANGRQSALETAVRRQMAEHACPYDEAFDRVQADPAYAALFAAMSDPTRRSG